MLSTYYNIWKYLKNPVCDKINNISTADKLKIVGETLILCFTISFVFAIFIGIIDHLKIINIDNHANSKLFDKYSPLVVVLLVAIVAPVLEELIFRAPITLFSKYKTSFKSIFYAFALVFGFIHIFNFELTPQIILLSPILVAPQICLGLFLGYLRVRLGLIYSIILHMTYNGILIIPSVLFMGI